MCLECSTRPSIASTSCCASSTATPPTRGTTRSSGGSSATSALPGSPARVVREIADEGRIRRLVRALGDAARREGVCYLTGGATAVLLGWRPSTLDVDILLEPEQDEVLRAIPRLKDELSVNVELASPADFLPLPRAWRERSPLVEREGRLSFRHFDFYSQTLAKLQRGHAQDLEDVREMLARGLVESRQLRACFAEIEPELYRFPAVDAAGFRSSVDEFLG